MINDTAATADHWIYLAASRRLPANLHDDIGKLFVFVSFVDGCLNSQPQDLKILRLVSRRWRNIRRSRRFGNVRALDDSPAERALSNICYLTHRYQLDPQLVDDFLAVKQLAANGLRCQTFDDTLYCLTGTAESVAVMAAVIGGLPEPDWPAVRDVARRLGMIDYISHLGRDVATGRYYLPRAELKKFGLKDMTYEEAQRKPAEWREFIEFQLARIEQWPIPTGRTAWPRRLRRSIKKTLNCYAWIKIQISRNPWIMFGSESQPSLWQKLVGRWHRS